MFIWPVDCSTATPHEPQPERYLLSAPFVDWMKVGNLEAEVHPVGDQLEPSVNVRLRRSSYERYKIRGGIASICGGRVVVGPLGVDRRLCRGGVIGDLPIDGCGIPLQQRRDQLGDLSKRRYPAVRRFIVEAHPIGQDILQMEGTLMGDREDHLGSQIGRCRGQRRFLP